MSLSYCRFTNAMQLGYSCTAASGKHLPRFANNYPEFNDLWYYGLLGGLHFIINSAAATNPSSTLAVSVAIKRDGGLYDFFYSSTYVNWKLLCIIFYTPFTMYLCFFIVPITKSRYFSLLARFFITISTVWFYLFRVLGNETVSSGVTQVALCT